MQSYELYSFCNEVIRSNSLILFDDDGSFYELEYARHIAMDIDEIPGRTFNTKIRNSIIAAVNLWNFWELTIRNSNYPYKWYGCVQFSEIWCTEGESYPPLVIFNSDYPDRIENSKDFRSIPKKELPVKIDLNQNSL